MTLQAIAHQCNGKTKYVLNHIRKETHGLGGQNQEQCKRRERR